MMSLAESGNPQDERTCPPHPGGSCLVYRTGNIGDMIQTLALTRLLGSLTGVFRHDLASAPRDRVFVVNGFLERDTPPRNGAACLFAGISGPYERQSLYLRWLRESPWPVGARDPLTVQRLTAAGLVSELTGCATLTLPRDNGPRTGVLSVDHDGPGTRITHNISRQLTVAEQWQQAERLLSRYRTAAEVHTTRLHVALPCLAMGTPVWIKRPNPYVIPERYSLLEELGVPYERLVVRDMSAAADRYQGFLRRHLGREIHPGRPQMPTLATPDRLRWWDPLWFRMADEWWSLRKRWGRLNARLRRRTER